MAGMKVVALALAVGVLLLVGAAGASAQDPLKVAPTMYKLVFENERVRVMEATLKPGEKIEMHSHPEHFAYPVSGGKVRFTYPDGKSQEAELKTGEVTWIAAETHAAENIGTTTTRVLVVELKK